MIYSIDIKIATIKHALNVSNSTNTFEVDGELMTVDTALIKMAQLNSRKKTLDIMRKRQEKARVNDVYSRNNVPEYVYTNYKVADAEDEFNKCSELITNIQLALDKYNQTVLFDVDIEN
jgi:hypothetical protein